MKFRWLAIALGLAAFTAEPWMLPKRRLRARIHRKPRRRETIPTRVSRRPVTCRMRRSRLLPPCPTQDDSQIKHNGGKTDVDAVGNRNVGCGRGVGQLVHRRRPGRARAVSTPSRSSRR